MSMEAPEAPAEDPRLAGGDSTKGRYSWHHDDCGTIYADSQDDAIAFAFTRLSAIDPGNAGRSCINVQRTGYNANDGAEPPEAA